MSEELISAREWVKKQGLGFPATQKVFEGDLKKAYKAGFEEGIALFNLPKGYKLKPCPFCGGEAEMLNGEVPCKYYVHHMDESGDCFISPILTITALTKVSAIEAWNRRTDDTMRTITSNS